MRLNTCFQLLGAITIAVRAEGVLDTEARESGATVVEKDLGVVGGTEVRVAVDTAVVVEERNGLAEELALLINATFALELYVMLEINATNRNK